MRSPAGGAASRMSWSRAWTAPHDRRQALHASGAAQVTAALASPLTVGPVTTPASASAVARRASSGARPASASWGAAPPIRAAASASSTGHAARARARRSPGRWRWGAPRRAHTSGQSPGTSAGAVAGVRAASAWAAATSEANKRAEASALESARLYEELSEHKLRLQHLVGKLVVAQEEERRRVAYEVHDGLAQVASAAYQHLQNYAADNPPTSARDQEELDEALEMLRRLAFTEQVDAPTQLDLWKEEAA